ncbi:MAG: hypothetical protein ACREM8_11380, partial [Vulcanimicrobiaceae bacterium]
MSRFLPVAVAIGVLITAATRAAGADQTGYLYSYAVNDTRYADTVGAIDAYKPFGSPAAVVRPYFGFLASLDSRSTGGSVPQTYNDNYAVGALGLQYTTPSGLRVFIQGGVSTPLGSVAAVPSGGDLRYGVQLYREWTGGAHAPRYYGNFYGSAAFTSRYSDSE